MRKFTTFSGIVCPLDRANVDTDAIIPKQFLKSIKRSGFGPNLFDAWRYLDSADGLCNYVSEPGQDCSGRPINPDFVLNDPKYANAEVLLTRENFGCGSSREHAPWALADYGFHVLIAESFADIFFNNCFKNGILAIVLDKTVVDNLFIHAKGTQPLRITVNLETQQLSFGTQTADAYGSSNTINFAVDPFRKHCLLEGLDDIGLTLQHIDDIRAYETQRRQRAPWAFV